MCDAELARRFVLDRVLCAAQKNSFNSLSFVSFRRLQNRLRAAVRGRSSTNSPGTRPTKLSFGAFYSGAERLNCGVESTTCADQLKAFYAEARR